MACKTYTHQRTKSAQVHGFIAFNFSKPKTSILARCVFFGSLFYWISRMKRKWAAEDDVCNMCYMNSYGPKHHRLEISNLPRSCFKHAQLPNTHTHTHTLCARVPFPILFIAMRDYQLIFRWLDYDFDIVICAVFHYLRAGAHFHLHLRQPVI